MTLPADEFIRRFLLHVLPPGFHRIRYYGLLGNRFRQENLERCYRVLQLNPTPLHKTNADASSDYRDRYESLTGLSLHLCPVCRRGRMVIIEQLSRPRALESVPVLDTS